MRFITLLGVAVLAGLPACMTGSPRNDAYATMSSGVGFGDYQRYLREREAATQRAGIPYSVAPEPMRIDTTARQQPAPAPMSAAALARQVETRPAPAAPQAMAAAPAAPAPAAPAAVGAPLAAPMAAAPVTTRPLPPAQAAPALAQPAPAAAPPAPQPTPQPVSQPAPFGTTPAFDSGPSVRPDLSDEQDFDAVAGRETIESDRERLARQRAQYRVVEVTSVPDASVRAGPNIVEFALSTSHPVGTRVYTRMNPLRWQRWENACLQYRTQEAAQEAFLAAGGPERDRHNLDPDGDGYACWWDPEPIRAAVRAARASQ